MRIVGGRHRGLALASVGRGDPAAQLRPTSDRVREAIFNVLAGGRFGDPLSEARVLDLFAGTGALGLEALSRGATFATFVDSGKAAGALIRENLDRAGRSGDASILARPAERLGPATGPAATLVFVDPPYRRSLGGQALTAARAGGWLADGALIVWEEAAPQTPPAGFALRDQRRWGDTHVTFLQCAERAAEGD